MNFLNKNLHKLETQFRRIYFEKEHIITGSRWQQDVMRTIRNIGPLNGQTAAFRFANLFVWRFAGVTCAAVLILAFYAVYNGYNPITVVNNFLFGNPVEISIAQAFGVY